MLPTEDSNINKNSINLNGKKKSNGVVSITKLRQTDKDVIRIIGQHLIDLGLQQSAEQLMQESGCELEQPLAKIFRQYVINGQWIKAESSLKDLNESLGAEIDFSKMQFLLLEQKYLEQLENGEILDALDCLRHQLTPMKYNTDRVHELSSYIMCSTPEDLFKMSNWSGKNGGSRNILMNNLLEFFPASVMLPPSRLITLLQQAVTLQRDRCPYHNARPLVNHSRTTSNGVQEKLTSSTSASVLIDTSVSSSPTSDGIDDFSLLTDHMCTKDDFPCQRLQTLTDHTDEVWFCRFSPDGSKLATGSKDGTMIIWQVDKDTRRVALLHTCSGHTFGVSFIAWSPDNKHIISLGPDDSSHIWIWNAETGDLHAKVNQSAEDSLTSASWHSDSKHFVVGGTRGQFYLCELDGTVFDAWDGVRIQSIACMLDNVTTLAADTHFRIRTYNFETKDDPKIIIQEDHPIMSFTLNNEANRCLLNVATKGIHLWDIKDRVILQKFQGVTQGFFTIHSCFGGTNQSYIASGSEDNKVYIWQTRSEHPIAILTGHQRNVNCVHWNPVYPDLLASASDDGTVRTWAPAVIIQQ